MTPRPTRPLSPQAAQILRQMLAHRAGARPPAPAAAAPAGKAAFDMSAEQQMQLLKMLLKASRGGIFPAGPVAP